VLKFLELNSVGLTLLSMDLPKALAFKVMIELSVKVTDLQVYYPSFTPSTDRVFNLLKPSGNFAYRQV
jgi:hypothetical protein